MTAPQTATSKKKKKTKILPSSVHLALNSSSLILSGKRGVVANLQLSPILLIFRYIFPSLIITFRLFLFGFVCFLLLFYFFFCSFFYRASEVLYSWIFLCVSSCRHCSDCNTGKVVLKAPNTHLLHCNIATLFFGKVRLVSAFHNLFFIIFTGGWAS